MTSSLALAVVIGGLVAVGFVLLTSRSLSRVVVGFVMLGHAVNLLLLLAGGPTIVPPLLGVAEAGQPADPLVQAFVLTAIVITFGVTVLLLGLVHRTWALHGSDELRDDPEDRPIARAEKLAEERDRAAESLAEGELQ